MKNNISPFLYQSPSKKELQLTKSMLADLFPKQFLSGLNKELRVRSPKSQSQKYSQLLELNKHYKNQLYRFTAAFLKQKREKEAYKQKLQALQSKILLNGVLLSDKKAQLLQISDRLRISSAISICQAPFKIDISNKISQLSNVIQESQQNLNKEEYMFKLYREDKNKYLKQIQHLKQSNQNLLKQNQFLKQSLKRQDQLKEDRFEDNNEEQYKMVINHASGVSNKSPQMSKNNSNIQINMSQLYQSQLGAHCPQIQASCTYNIEIPSQLKLTAQAYKQYLNSSIMSINTQDIDDILKQEVVNSNNQNENQTKTEQIDTSQTCNLNSSIIAINLNA